MAGVKTVDGSIQSIDPLISKQKEDVAKMRASLLCCNDDPYAATQAMKNITVLRVYHQMSRIIRYLEMMDKIEEKLYRSIEASMDNMDEESPVTWMTLLNIQTRLQQNLIDSHKLLQPYLNVQEMSIEDLAPTVTQIGKEQSMLTRETRDKLRISAQQVLDILEPYTEEVEDVDD